MSPNLRALISKNLEDELIKWCKPALGFFSLAHQICAFNSKQFLALIWKWRLRGLPSFTGPTGQRGTTQSGSYQLKKDQKYREAICSSLVVTASLCLSIYMPSHVHMYSHCNSYHWLQSSLLPEEK